MHVDNIWIWIGKESSNFRRAIPSGKRGGKGWGQVVTVLSHSVCELFLKIRV